MSSIIADLDKKKTKKVVEAALEKYRIYLLTVPEYNLPEITQSYSLIPPAKTNKVYSSTEKAVIRKVDFENERSNYLNHIALAVNRLNESERTIIIKRFMQKEDAYDYEIYNEMGFSESKYYRLKDQAYCKLAFVLNLEVYKEEN